MPQNPISIYSQFPGGTKSAMNVTAAGVIKSTPGVLYRISTVVAGTGGALLLADTNALVTAQTITGITAAANAVVTISTGGSSNPFAVGNTVAFASVGGMTQINAVVGTVLAIGGVTTAWTITTSINSSAFSAWTSAGTIASFSAANEFGSYAFGVASAGSILTIDWPCQYGIAVVGITTGGGTYAFSYF